jgi:hypothetical protein
MSEPSKIVPMVSALVPGAIAAVKRRFDGYPRFALEFARPALPLQLPLPVRGFGIPGGMRDERGSR